MCFRIVRIEGDGSVKLIFAGDVTAGAINCNEVHNKEEIIEYGKKRLEATSNIYLLSRYNHVLYNLTKNTLFCENAINSYNQIFKQYVDKKVDGYKRIDQKGTKRKDREKIHKRIELKRKKRGFIILF